jgi:hypothetical protein
MTYTWNVGGTSSTTTANSATSQALTANTTYTVQIRNSNGCVGAVSAPATITVATMPAAATVTRVSAATVCEGTNVVFRASGTAGSTYTWLGTAGTASGTGNGTLTVSGTATGSKSVSAYARLTSSGTTCQSANAATVTAVVATIPTIALTSATATANQTVTAGTKMTAISYTANNSATITLNSGSSFPTGVSGKANGSSYTISGQPSATGTFGYSLTATVGGCTSDAAAGTITVEPSAFATSSTWSYGGSIWSDRVVASPTNCTWRISFLSEDALPPQYRYIVDGSITRFWYNWACAQTVCPSGWSLPTQAQFEALAYPGYPLGEAFSKWGYGGGMAYGTQWISIGDGFLWGSAPGEADGRHYALHYGNGIQLVIAAFDDSGAMEVRCVKQ